MIEVSDGIDRLLSRGKLLMKNVPIVVNDGKLRVLMSGREVRDKLPVDANEGTDSVLSSGIEVSEKALVTEVRDGNESVVIDGRVVRLIEIAVASIGILIEFKDGSEMSVRPLDVIDVKERLVNNGELLTVRTPVLVTAPNMSVVSVCKLGIAIVDSSELEANVIEPADVREGRFRTESAGAVIVIEVLTNCRLDRSIELSKGSPVSSLMTVAESSEGSEIVVRDERLLGLNPTPPTTWRAGNEIEEINGKLLI